MGSILKKYFAGITILSVICFSTVSYAHSGRTDKNGGHKDNKNVSGLGSYHYHCGGYEAHLHTNGYCPYSSGGKSSTSTSIKETTEVSKPVVSVVEEPKIENKVGDEEVKLVEKVEEKQEEVEPAQENEDNQEAIVMDEIVDEVAEVEKSNEEKSEDIEETENKKLDNVQQNLNEEVKLIDYEKTDDIADEEESNEYKESPSNENDDSSVELGTMMVLGGVGAYLAGKKSKK